MTKSTRIRSLPPILIATLLAPLPLCAQQTQTSLDETGQWIVTDAPEQGSDAETLAQARVKVAQGHPGSAIAILNKWIKAHKDTTNPYLPQAYLLRGRAKMANGDEFKALYDFERLIREFPASEQFLDANYEEYKIALAYLDGLNRKTFGLRISPAEGVGEEMLVRVAERLPGSTLTEQIYIALSDYYYFRAVNLEYAALIDSFLIEQFPNTRFKKEAMARQIYANVARFKGPRYDASTLIEAGHLIDRFEAHFPVDARRTGIGDALSARINESLALQILESAKWYANRGDLPSTTFVLKRLIRKHPHTVAAARGRQLAQKIGLTLEPTTNQPDPPNPNANPNANPSAIPNPDPAPPSPDTPAESPPSTDPATPPPAN